VRCMERSDVFYYQDTAATVVERQCPCGEPARSGFQSIEGTDKADLNP
jgi:hypothetical protein